MMVRFATLCDKCHARSDEYTAWPTCRDCGEHVCNSCHVKGSETDADVDSPTTVLCKECANAQPDGWSGVVEDEEGNDRS